MVDIQQNIPLAPLTTFKVGGPARYFVAADSEADLAEALNFAREQGLSVFVLGGGSNILFSDQGFDGLVIKMENRELSLERECIKVGAGIKLMEVVLFARDHALAGIESLAGIPGSVGGAIRGNAGAFGAEIGNVVMNVRAFNQVESAVREFPLAECEFSYRNSFFKQHREWLVLSAELQLKPGDKEAIAQVVDKTVAVRESKHPQDAQCAGSFFMNPIVADMKLREEFEREAGVTCKDNKLPAGWLIDHVGLRGKKIGGAMVSEIHPNYILNAGGAKAEDIVMLSSVIKQRVRTQLGVQLREEVQMVGF